MIFIGIVLGFLGGFLFSAVVASKPGFLRTPEKPSSERLQNQPAGLAPWAELEERAGRAVEAAQAEIPDDIRAEALAVPTLFQEWHPTRSRVLGVYWNNRSPDMATRKGPIILYLRAIEAYAARCRLGFEDQVRATYLHELGHHVGWNEGQVQERGL
jgi:predicted Zn-dependent protease with MMP-like domain